MYRIINGYKVTIISRVYPIYLLLKQCCRIKLGSSAKIINNSTHSPQRTKTNTQSTLEQHGG